jgi:hypothetical protein
VLQNDASCSHTAAAAAADEVAAAALVVEGAVVLLLSKGFKASVILEITDDAPLLATLATEPAERGNSAGTLRIRSLFMRYKRRLGVGTCDMSIALSGLSQIELARHTGATRNNGRE